MVTTQDVDAVVVACRSPAVRNTEATCIDTLPGQRHWTRHVLLIGEHSRQAGYRP